MGSKSSKLSNKEEKKKSKEIENFDLHHAALRENVFGEEIESDWTSGLTGQRASLPKPKPLFESAHDDSLAQEGKRSKRKKFGLWN